MKKSNHTEERAVCALKQAKTGTQPVAADRTASKAFPSQGDDAAHGQVRFRQPAMKAVSDHSKDEEVARYTAAANQPRTAAVIHG